jgi:tripartite-type tricarboxylate transporter receptor subunit TctC
LIRKSKSIHVLILVLLLSLTLLGGCAAQQTQAPAEKPAEKPYFEGKNITIIVPNSPGGAHDTAARTLAPYIQQYSGAKNVVVENKKGGGGILGMNQIWHTKGDGETIMLASAATHLLAYIAGSEGLEFDPTKTTWLARAIQKPYVLTVGKKSNINNADDLKNLNRPYVYPAVGLDDDFYTMSVIAKSLGIDLKIVTGFDGEGECQLAQVQGTVDGLFTAHAKADPLVKAGDTVPIMILGANRVDWEGYQSLPTVLEVVGDGPGKQAMADIVTIYDLYESIWGPPNMDPAATAAWRDILDKVLTDPEVITKIIQIGGTPAYLPGEKLQVLIPELMETAKSLKVTFDEAAAAIK